MKTYYPTLHDCTICGKSGANYRTPLGEYIHERCGKKKWNKMLAKKAKKK